MSVKYYYEHESDMSMTQSTVVTCVQ
jgi:hypothetical protein